MTIVTVPVDLPGREYDVQIGHGALADIGSLIAPLLVRPKVTVISDATVADRHLDRLRTGLGAIELTNLSLPPGESTKGWRGLEQATDFLLDAKVERRDVIIAFGGGVIGDLVGFAAAILRRGVRFVQVPTTLLAQVDSAVGGKTAINTRHGKNLIGAFHQPSMVVADIALLETLPRRDFLAGYGEVVKYGLLGDHDFFVWLEENGPSLLAGDTAARTEAVRHSCAMKADIVRRDETEQGDRALLNLGHTFAHALETATGYSDRLLHGEAVSIGCLLAFDLSARMGLCSQETPVRVAAHLAEMGMRSNVGDIPGDLPDAEALIALMAQDKKVQNGQLTFVLAHGIGEAFVAREIDVSALRDVLSSALGNHHG